MTSKASADRDAAPGPVAPATIVRVLVRPLTKVLNPLMVRLAGRRFFPMAQIHHVGRRSGKAYVTPTSAHIRGDRCRRLRARQLIAEVRQALPGVAGPQELHVRSGVFRLHPATGHAHPCRQAILGAHQPDRLPRPRWQVSLRSPEIFGLHLTVSHVSAFATRIAFDWPSSGDLLEIRLAYGQMASSLRDRMIVLCAVRDHAVRATGRAQLGGSCTSTAQGW